MTAAGGGEAGRASRVIPTLMLFAAGITLGLSFSLNRIAITSGIPFIPFVFWVSLGAGLAGVLLLVVPQASLPDPDMVGWVLLSLLVPVCYALSNVLAVVLRPPRTASLPLAAGILLTAAILLLPVMAGTGSWWWFEGPMGAGDWSLVGVAAVTGLFFWLLFEIIRRAGPVFFSMQNYIATLAGILWGMLIHDERHSVWIWAALVLLFVGLTLVVRGSAAPRAAD